RRPADMPAPGGHRGHRQSRREQRTQEVEDVERRPELLQSVALPQVARGEQDGPARAGDGRDQPLVGRVEDPGPPPTLPPYLLPVRRDPVRRHARRRPPEGELLVDLDPSTLPG